MVEAARAGGEVALAHFRCGTEATLKPDGSPVTEADREAEEVIARTLGAAFPEHGVLGEELGARGPSERRFIVDPIDGTRNFIRGIPLWATLVALEEHGEVTAGVVYQPVTRIFTRRAAGRAPSSTGSPSRCRASPRSRRPR